MDFGSEEWIGLGRVIWGKRMGMAECFCSGVTEWDVGVAEWGWA